jgi:hypothetical protein
MINVATVHFQSDEWIDPQLRFLESNISAPYRVFASLEGIDDPEMRSRFYAVHDGEGRHPDKLNTLASVITAQSQPTDVLMFLDGDAFPIRPLVPWIDEILREFPLAAVRRDENDGDTQPHPCFCITTVGFWNDLGGDWSKGSWTTTTGKTAFDVGGTLYHQLEERGVPWHPMLRTNTVNPHPLWFAVYEHKVYHHGAGFRRRNVSRIDAAGAPEVKNSAAAQRDGEGLGVTIKAAVRHPWKAVRTRPLRVGEVTSAAIKTVAVRRRRASWVRRRQHLHKTKERSGEEARRVFTELCQDPLFYRQFESSP